jgi:hypothetical protein
MNSQRWIATSVLAGLMGLAGVCSAQAPAATKAPDRPDGSAPASREAVKAAVPKGEATTTVNHQPNAMPRPSENSRSEVREQALKVKPQFGQRGERPDVPTNPTDRTGTPQ